MKLSNALPAVSYWENADTMGERMGRIRRIPTDFFIRMHGFQAKKSKKIKKNPLESAESAPSVLPLYRG